MKHKKKFTPQDYKVLEHLSAIRVPLDQIAAVLEISKDTLERMLKSDSAARAAVEGGRARASTKVRSTLYQMAIGKAAVTKEVRTESGALKTVVVEDPVPPDFQSLKFWCQTQEGFKSADRLELTGANGGPIVSASVDEETVKEVFSDPDTAKLARELALQLSKKA